MDPVLVCTKELCSLHKETGYKSASMSGATAFSREKSQYSNKCELACMCCCVEEAEVPCSTLKSPIEAQNTTHTSLYAIGKSTEMVKCYVMEIENFLLYQLLSRKFQFRAKVFYCSPYTYYPRPHWWSTICVNKIRQTIIDLCCQRRGFAFYTFVVW